MRTMADSTAAADIPQNVDMVAGYIDGIYKWSQADWDRFPATVRRVEIAINVNTNAGQVGDIEWGDMTNEQAPVWAHMRRATGQIPTIYTSESNWAAVRQCFTDADETEPIWWIAHYGIAPNIPNGAVALQYANDTFTGGHYDASVVADYWPGVDMTPDEVKALIAEYALSLETNELLPMKQRLDVLETAANAPVKPHTHSVTGTAQ